MALAGSVPWGSITGLWQMTQPSAATGSFLGVSQNQVREVESPAQVTVVTP